MSEQLTDLSFSVSGRVSRPVREVYEAVADPEQLSRYFTTGGARGRLEAGAEVSWDFHDFPGRFPVEVVEAEVGALFPGKEWTQLSHNVIWHGRRCCHARRPACGACPVARLCPSYGEGPTDPKVAVKLLREPRG